MCGSSSIVIWGREREKSEATRYGWASIGPITAPPLLDAIAALLPSDANLLLYGTEPGQVVAAGHDAAWVRAHPSPENNKVTATVRRPSQFEVPKVNIQCYGMEVAAIDALMKDLTARFGKCLVFSRCGDATPEIDVVAQGADKDSAARLIACELGIPLQDAIVFGDSDSDLPLLDLPVAASYVVSNGSGAARAAATYVIGACQDHAVAQIVQRL